MPAHLIYYGKFGVSDKRNALQHTDGADDQCKVWRDPASSTHTMERTATVWQHSAFKVAQHELQVLINSLVPCLNG